MKILIIGGAGFIGSALIRYLIRDTNNEIINLDKLTYAGNLDSLLPVTDSPRYHFEKADICDREALDGVFIKYQPDAVMHLAAESHVDRSIDGPGGLGETYNIGGLNEKKNIDVVKTTCAIMDEAVTEKPAGVNKFEDLITFVADRPGHDERYAIDASKINADLDWVPDEDIASGFRKTVLWYLKNTEWWQSVIDGSYRLNRIGVGE